MQNCNLQKKIKKTLITNIPHQKQNCTSLAKAKTSKKQSEIIKLTCLAADVGSTRRGNVPLSG